MTNLFTYGSLMYPSVIYSLIQHHYQASSAILHDYIRKHIHHQVYPGITQSTGHSVNGTDIAFLDKFEGDEYEKRQVVVVNEKGEKVDSIVYVIKDKNKLTQQEWNQKQFQDKHQATFANDHSIKK